MTVLLESWSYSREAVAQGEVWRLLGASWSHLSVAHLAGNLAALAAVVLVLRNRLGWRTMLTVLALGSVAVPASLHAFTALGWYAGLSGAIHALLAHGLAFGAFTASGAFTAVGGAGTPANAGGGPPWLASAGVPPGERTRAAASRIARAAAPAAALLLLGVLVALDQQRTVSWSGEPLAPQSHLAGFALGVASALVAAGWRWRPSREARSARTI